MVIISIAKICFVRPLDRGDNLPKDVKYPLNNQMTLVVPGIVRYCIYTGGRSPSNCQENTLIIIYCICRCSAIDVLYQGNDDLSLSECVLESLSHVSLMS
jgi:hypothetical protein